MKQKLWLETRLFLIGSIGYSLLEILWRGFTHWTMAVTGGFCFSALYFLNQRYESAPLWRKCLNGSLLITAAELVVGCIVNLGLHWQVWDYSKMPLNLWGQICLPYTGLWFLLSMPICFLTRFIRMQVEGKAFTKGKVLSK